MKKLFGYVAAFLVLFTSVFTTVVNAKEATIVTIPSTTEGIDIEVDVKYNSKTWTYDYELKYVITDEYDADANNGKINLNFAGDLEDLFEAVFYVPGDGANVNISLVNNSKYEFNYDKTVISTVDIANRSDNAGDIKIDTFDGNKVSLSSEWNIQRTQNEALKKLLNTTKTSASYYEEKLIVAALDKIVDENGEKKYPNGIDDLDKYYVDYLNTKYSKSNKELNEFTYKELSVLFRGNALRVRETNKNVALIGYNEFYNKLLAIVPNSVAHSTDPDAKYSIGSYMTSESSELYSQFSNDFNKVVKGEEYNTKFTVLLNGPYTDNAWQSYNFAFDMEVVLAAKKAKVTTNYVDEDGKSLKDSTVESYYVGSEYQTEAKEIEGYEMIEVEGEEKGTLTDDITVTYVYQFVMGEGGEEFPIVQTGSEVDYSIMSSALITLSLIGLAFKSNKKNK